MKPFSLLSSKKNSKKRSLEREVVGKTKSAKTDDETEASPVHQPTLNLEPISVQDELDQFKQKCVQIQVLLQAKEEEISLLASDNENLQKSLVKADALIEKLQRQIDAKTGTIKLYNEKLSAIYSTPERAPSPEDMVEKLSDIAAVGLAHVTKMLVADGSQPSIDAILTYNDRSHLRRISDPPLPEASMQEESPFSKSVWIIRSLLQKCTEKARACNDMKAATSKEKAEFLETRNMVTVLDALVHCVNPRFVSVSSYVLGFFVKCMSKSKAVVNYIRGFIPAGTSYETYQNHVESMAANLPEKTSIPFGPTFVSTHDNNCVDYEGHHGLHSSEHIKHNQVWTSRQGVLAKSKERSVELQYLDAHSPKVCKELRRKIDTPMSIFFQEPTGVRAASIFPGEMILSDAATIECENDLQAAIAHCEAQSALEEARKQILAPEDSSDEEEDDESAESWELRKEGDWDNGEPKFPKHCLTCLHIFKKSLRFCDKCKRPGEPPLPLNPIDFFRNAFGGRSLYWQYASNKHHRGRVVNYREIYSDGAMHKIPLEDEEELPTIVASLLPAHQSSRVFSDPIEPYYESVMMPLPSLQLDPSSSIACAEILRCDEELAGIGQVDGRKFFYKSSDGGARKEKVEEKIQTVI